MNGFMTLGILTGLASLAAGSSVAAAAAPKYYFQLTEVKAGPQVAPALKVHAAEALKADLAGRPEWAADLGGAEGSAAVAAALKKRNLRGFDVTVRLEEIKKELKEPNPGGRLKRLAVNVRLTVFGTTIPEAKLAFSGDGEAGMEAEIVERQMEAEAASLTKDAIKIAVKQAVDQAVMKLSIGKSAPLTEGKRKKKK
jgi:hypothetical protein